MTVVGEAENVIDLLALTFGWTRLSVDKRGAREGPPTTKSHGAKERSLFRCGLDWLQNIFTTPEPQDKAFFNVCQRSEVLRRP